MNMPIAILNRRRRGAGVAAPEATWVIEGSTIMQSPTPPDAADYRIVGTTVEAV